MGTINIGGAEVFADEMVRACLPLLPAMYYGGELRSYFKFVRGPDMLKPTLEINFAGSLEISAKCVIRRTRTSFKGGTCVITVKNDELIVPSFEFELSIDGVNFRVTRKPKLILRRYSVDPLAARLAEIWGRSSTGQPIKVLPYLWWASCTDEPIDVQWIEAHGLNNHVCGAYPIGLEVLALDEDGEWSSIDRFVDDCELCDASTS